MQRSMVGRRMAIRVVAALTILAGLASCRPNFVDGSTLQTAVEGDGVRLSWSPGRTDADRTVVSYRVDVDGTEITRVDASETSCLLTGLTAGAAHDVEITVYDSAGEWSGESGFIKSVLATVTGPAGSTGTGIACPVVAPPTPAAVSVTVSQPSPGANTKVIGGQVAPITYDLAVANTGDTASGEVTVSNPVPAGATLVADSPSCGTATGCTFEVVAGSVQWTLLEIDGLSSVDLSFSVTVNPELGSTTSIDNVATYTAAGQTCDTDPCTTNTVVNAAEPWAWTNWWPVFIDPINSVFYSGRNTFRHRWNPANNGATVITNDPAATVSLDWSCYPDQLCLIESITGDDVLFNFVWDSDDFQNWAIYLRATAHQGDRTLTFERFMEFSLEKGSIFTTSAQPGSEAVPTEQP